MTVPLAFYAPLKSPDHPAPSGDRTMARLMVRALSTAGFQPALSSRLRTLDLAGDAVAQQAAREASEAEADRLLAAYRAGLAARPAAWFTYHCHYKAPDWIGPRIADALAIPYAVAEGSRARSRATGPWALAHAGATAALDRADVVFALTRLDAEALRRDAPAGQQVVDLPPFLALDEWPAAAGPARRSGRTLRLLAVAMMREGDKLASYRLLAEALSRVAAESWTLSVAGDGPARPAVEALLAPFGTRVRWLGAVADRAALSGLYGASDLLVWPAVNEAYGMALLEAQATGCPVLAGRFGGVADVVRDGETGLLVEPGSPEAFAAALRGLLAEPGPLRSMGERARLVVREEHDLPAAALRLGDALRPLLGRRRAA